MELSTRSVMSHCVSQGFPENQYPQGLSRGGAGGIYLKESAHMIVKPAKPDICKAGWTF